MFNNFFSSLSSRTLAYKKSLTLKNSKIIQRASNQSKDEQEYQYGLQKNRSIIRQILFGEANEITLLKRCVSDRVSTEKVLQFGELAMWDLYCQKDYLNSFKAGQIILPYVTQEISNEDMSIGHISLIMAESCIKQYAYSQALQYLHSAEESFHLNQEELEEEPSMNYFYSLKIAQLYSMLSMVEKSYLYASMCLKTKRLSFSQKISPCYLLLNYYVCKKNYTEALSFGDQFLEQISFKEVVRKYQAQQIESLIEFYKTMIHLKYEEEKNSQKTFVLIDQLLLLLSITNSQDVKLIQSMEHKKEIIKQELDKQQDLLFVLGFYGQKLKLESSPETITQTSQSIEK